ncbi:MAG: hypothetical protein R6V06_08535 [Kiritimatiellia bacterium]
MVVVTGEETPEFKTLCLRLSRQRACRLQLEPGLTHYRNKYTEKHLLFKG